MWVVSLLRTEEYLFNSDVGRLPFTNREISFRVQCGSSPFYEQRSIFSTPMWLVSLLRTEEYVLWAFYLVYDKNNLKESHIFCCRRNELQLSHLCASWSRDIEIRGGKEAAIIDVLAGGRYVGWSQVQRQLKIAVFFSDSCSMRLYIQIFFYLYQQELVLYRMCRVKRFIMHVIVQCTCPFYL